MILNIIQHLMMKDNKIQLNLLYMYSRGSSPPLPSADIPTYNQLSL